MNIEICYATPQKQKIESYIVPEGMTLREALDHINLPNYFARNFPEISAEILSQLDLGIFSKPQNLDYILQAEDRIEIYRSLTTDPMKKRQLRHHKNPLKQIPR